MKSTKKKLQERGSITLFVLITMMALLIIIIGTYVSSNNSVKKQEREIEKIQKEYEKEDINDIYEKASEN